MEVAEVLARELKDELIKQGYKSLRELWKLNKDDFMDLLGECRTKLIDLYHPDLDNKHPKWPCFDVAKKGGRTVQELTEWLQAHGVDTSEWGTGTRKVWRGSPWQQQPSFHY